MEKQAEFTVYLENLKADNAKIDFTITLAEEFIDYAHNCNPDKITLESIKTFCNEKITGKADALSRITALARFCKFFGKDHELIYPLSMGNTLGVMDSMRKKLTDIVGKKAADEVFNGISEPALGSLQEEYPPFINQYMQKLQNNLSFCDCKRVLTGNHHGVPAEAFNTDKIKFKELGSIDLYLKYRHEKLINETSECMNAGKLWYEQKITPEVIEFIKSNQEIQSGVRIENKIYVTKIPFDPAGFLKETNPINKRYLACHCPFVRASIKETQNTVPGLWCYCTGGFEKLVFDIIYENDLEVELVESVLSGNEKCRFAITIPE